MPIDRIDINKKWPIPSGIKLILMVLVIFGFLVHRCWKKNQGSNILISDIEVSEITKVSADITFFAANRASVELTKAVKISLYTKNSRLIADKLTNITIPAKSKKKYIKLMQKFKFPVNDPNSVGKATVEIYK